MRWLPTLVIALMASGAHADAPVATALGPAVDLTWVFDASTLYWPSESEGFVLDGGSEGVTAAGYWYAAHHFRAPEHGGTHLDAPIHFHEGGSTTDRVPLGRLVAPAVVVDVSEACAKNPDYAIGVGDVERFEARYGRVPDGSALLFRTGFGARWPDRLRYLGTEERGGDAPTKLHFPGLDPAAARWLVANRKVAAVGLDTASIDPGTSRLFESHQVLFAAEIPAFENLAHLDQLPATGAILIALPMKIGGGSGGPLRAIAILPHS